MRVRFCCAQVLLKRGLSKTSFLVRLKHLLMFLEALLRLGCRRFCPNICPKWLYVIAVNIALAFANRLNVRTACYPRRIYANSYMYWGNMAFTYQNPLNFLMKLAKSLVKLNTGSLLHFSWPLSIDTARQSCSLAAYLCRVRANAARKGKTGCSA